jgi:hypothetical protein
MVTVAVMHVRDLGRRRLALAILVLLPLAFYFSAELQPIDPDLERVLAQDPGGRAAAELWILGTGTIGAGWAIAVAALFLAIGSRRIDQPLLLAGFRPAELVLGRMATVLVLAAIVMPLFALVIWSQRDVDLPLLIAATCLSAVVAAATGVLAAALVPREMEGVLVIIGVIGVQMSMEGQRWMPLWGAMELVKRAGGVPDAAATATASAHAIVFSICLLAVGIVLWNSRVKLRRPTRVLPTQAAAEVSVVGRAT